MAGEVNDYGNVQLSDKLSHNLNIFKEIFKKDSLLRTKEISSYGRKYALVYLDGMTDSKLLNDSVVRPLVMIDRDLSSGNFADNVASMILFAGEVKKTDSVKSALQAILYGDTLLIIDKSSEMLIINTLLEFIKA